MKNNYKLHHYCSHEKFSPLHICHGTIQYIYCRLSVNILSYLIEALKNIITKETHVCLTNADHFNSSMKPAM